MYLIGYDIGSSSIKTALVDAQSGEVIDLVQSPSVEMEIVSPRPGWAEQDPETWWKHVIAATKKIQESHPEKLKEVQAIGISYQMHGLVLVDESMKALRPSIIWCDSRAVPYGSKAFESLGSNWCLSHLLNSPGNFTASKLKWVIEEEPHIYEQAKYLMLPGDFIALKMTGNPVTTVSGLSEGMFWDFSKEEVSGELLDHYGIDRGLIPPIVGTFSEQGRLSREASELLGLPVGTRVSYRAGDQPNNALCLNVLQPGEIAATGGTSGVVYGVVDTPQYDLASRVNGFAHVNHTKADPRIGILLCINGTGIQYNWIRQNCAPEGISYPEMEAEAQRIPIGSEGLSILPFGNGSERMLENVDMGAYICNLKFNRHKQAHLYRAALEGIAFSFVAGMKIMREMGISIEVLRVGNDNMFQSEVFSTTLATLIGSEIQVLETSGAIGAAKASGVGVGIYQSPHEAVSAQEEVRRYHPLQEKASYEEAYHQWEKYLYGVKAP
ncbi:MAG: FGGY family carbohydrate kinase [Bacteroidota bacterium]